MKIEEVIKLSECVIDASVVVKWFSQEIQSDKAELILQQAFHQRLILYAPDILVYEVGNALWKGKQLDEQRIIAALEMVLSFPLQLRTVDMGISSSVVSIMCRYNLTFYNAAYAGLAFVLECPLITANPKDHQRIKDIRVVNL